MCGIIGYIGSRQALPILLNGLKRLEYRGYDSAGVGVINKKRVTVIKASGKISNLEDLLKDYDEDTRLGIGHTRWATHGAPTDINAHPHTNGTSTIAIVHNGIIENYRSLKTMLKEMGYQFASETDSEVIAHLISYFYDKENNLFNATRLALHEVEGAYGICVISSLEPDKIICARKGSPLIIGVGDGEHFVASDAPAILEYTNNVIFLEDGDIAEVTKDKFIIRSLDNQIQNRDIEKLDLDISTIEKGGFPHFMLKEIFEQPESIQNSIRGRIILSAGNVKLGGLEPVIDDILDAKRLIITACGTSWHAGLVGEYMLEQFAEIPVEVEYASEFRYRNPVITKNDVVIAISQSGETADTLAAIREAKKRNALVLGICNVVGSSIARETQAGVYIHAGPELGVASTKAFTSQLAVLALISVLIGRRKNLPFSYGEKICQELLSLPGKIQQILEQADYIKSISEKFVNAKNFLYLGRGYNFPVALEGALKLKEISYIHAEGYPAAEMKHGPIALVDENMPVVFIAIKDSTYDKILSNIEEVKARKGKVIAIVSEDDKQIKSLVDYTIPVPNTIEMLSPILTIIPLQLMAYYIAVAKGLNVDQPRNLAKSVTVE
ncbi:MAG: glutamine--fructose-6-phosphate transaminase (isomerizing) [Ignavibacteria bacterium]|jgi:glucosamine--fructose-6-phosphate aminotransferase (isomerizing)|nr:glutamine--fructose-6-phosphate transaminase (isomerizing) [Ignavibacteria bacterium]MDH7527645.1 glutamine--fructose-6-phosphate transaminase (isomerizing) [Ignavibacteria bacterium]